MQHAPHNFIGIELFEALIEGMRWAADQRARAVMLRSGLRNFCAGADIGLFESAERGVAPDRDFSELLAGFRSTADPDRCRRAWGVCRRRAGGGACRRSDRGSRVGQDRLRRSHHRAQSADGRHSADHRTRRRGAGQRNGAAGTPLRRPHAREMEHHQPRRCPTNSSPRPAPHWPTNLPTGPPSPTPPPRRSCPTRCHTGCGRPTRRCASCRRTSGSPTT